ncbi:hypothetical protein FKM82_009597 [Ascaphus truei]
MPWSLGQRIVVQHTDVTLVARLHLDHQVMHWIQEDRLAEGDSDQVVCHQDRVFQWSVRQVGAVQDPSLSAGLCSHKQPYRKYQHCPRCDSCRWGPQQCA